MAAASAYPPPPPFYRLYAADGPPPPPPPPPITGAYQMLDGSYTTEDALPSLEEQGVRQLYTRQEPIGFSFKDLVDMVCLLIAADFKKELRTLSRELLLVLLELVDVLVERPSQYARRVEDMGLLLKNIHHLLNLLRPHQARATVIHLLETQLQQRKIAIEDIRQRRQEAQELLRDSVTMLQKELDIDIAQDQEEIAGAGAMDAS
eukprot:SM000140S00586  [mRNA]  locus=s140:73414:74976:- [translate_table: standard]